MATIVGITALLAPFPSTEVVFERVHADEMPDVVLVDNLVPPTLEERADAIALEYGIATSTLRNLVYYESRWNPNAEGDSGCSWGLVQINLCVHESITKEEALNPEFALRYAAKEIAAGREYAWSVCNCFAIARNNASYPLPRMADIYPNIYTPEVGGIAIFQYRDKDTGKLVKHVAEITKIEQDGFWIFEGNFEPCKVASRFIKNDDSHFVGTYYPG